MHRNWQFYTQSMTFATQSHEKVKACLCKNKFGKEPLTKIFTKAYGYIKGENIKEF